MLDFYDAHLRHLRDAEILYAQSRWANADHLYGFAAECGLKRLMQAFGMDVNNMQDDKKHVSNIRNRYETYRSGRQAGAGYILPASFNSFSNPYWDVNQRYDHESYCNQAFVDPHKTAALHVKNLIDKAKKDGWILV